MPVASVVMPAFNAAAHIAETIVSILASGFADFEFIILDDGSTDATPEIVRGFGDPRIRFVANPMNRGVAAVRNQGHDLATGRYVVVMDADDIAEPDRIGRLVAFLDANTGIALCGSQLTKFGGETGLSQYPVGERDIAAVALFYCTHGHPTVAYRREVLAQHGIRYRLDYRVAHDYHLYVQCLMKGLRLQNLPESLVRYRVHGTSLSGSGSERMKQESRLIRAEYFDACFPAASIADRTAFGALAALEMPVSRGAMLRLCGTTGRLSDLAETGTASFDQRTFQTLLAQYWAIAAGHFASRGLCALTDYEAVALCDPAFSGFLRRSVPVFRRVAPVLAALSDRVERDAPAQPSA